ncbi:MAG: hypothetical protein KatS3mg105_0077 [Gemmatales bacterium]|nr:MAG: hypothetical protein KatS3mg105_0077 [Gemmatales bacterium]
MLPDDAANQKLEQDRKKLEEERKRRQEQQQFEQELASGSDELRELKSLQREQNWRSDPGDQNMVQSLKEFVNAHQNLPDDCVEFIRTWLESIPNYSSVWDEPDAMKGKNKDKPKYGSQAIREIVRKVNPRFRTKDH